MSRRIQDRHLGRRRVGGALVRLVVRRQRGAGGGLGAGPQPGAGGGLCRRGRGGCGRGFPFRFDTKLRAVTFGDPRQGWEWSVPNLNLFMLAYRPNFVRAALPGGANHPTWRAADEPRLRAHAGKRAAGGFDRSGLERISLDFDKLALSGSPRSPAASARWTPISSATRQTMRRRPVSAEHRACGSCPARSGAAHDRSGPGARAQSGRGKARCPRDFRPRAGPPCLPRWRPADHRIELVDVRIVGAMSSWARRAR